MSATRLCSSQLTTVCRKLPTIIPTPMATLTATISAATATAVRESVAVTSRAAMLPSRPKTRPSTGRARRIMATVASGVSSAAPITIAKSEPKASVSDWSEPACCDAGISSTAQPRAIIAAPTRASRGTRPRTRSSKLERRSTVRGGVSMASTAGTRAESSVAPTPSSRPFSSTHGSTLRPRTVTTKYRSLIVRVTSCTRPRPSSTPSSRPSSAPTRLITAASASTMPIIWPRVTPTQRSVPSSVRRCTTLNVIVL